MPTTLHEELARASERDGVSLNQFITSVLAGAVGWRRDESDPAVAASAATTSNKSKPRSLSVLLVANLVLVAAAAVAAIAFLLAAWLSS
jgi:HicB family